jgi:5-formyltetrahydrofolate cyclo-ligase
MSDLPSPKITKKALRPAARAVRAAARAAAGEAAGGGLARSFLSAIDCPPPSVVAGYWPMDDEADIRPLLERLAAQGCVVALPVVVARSTPLIFRCWQPGDALEDGLHRTRHPLPTALEVTPDLLLVPLLAFDHSGRRLGYGGGYYDRTLAALRDRRPVVAIGVAFAAQEVERLPDGGHDQRLDWIVTEESAWKAGP